MAITVTIPYTVQWDIDIIYYTLYRAGSQLIIYLRNYNKKGQEPDIIRGGYEIDQTYQGNITELNMWDKVLNETTIKVAILLFNPNV